MTRRHLLYAGAILLVIVLAPAAFFAGRALNQGKPPEPVAAASSAPPSPAESPWPLAAADTGCVQWNTQMTPGQRQQLARVALQDRRKYPQWPDTTTVLNVPEPADWQVDLIVQAVTSECAKYTLNFGINGSIEHAYLRNYDRLKP